MDRVILLCQIEFSGPKCNNISGVEVGALANDTTAASVTSITSEVNWCSAGIVEIDHSIHPAISAQLYRSHQMHVVQCASSAIAEVLQQEYLAGFLVQ